MIALNSPFRLSAECLRRIHQDQEGRRSQTWQQRSPNEQDLFLSLRNDAHHSGALEHLDGMVFSMLYDVYGEQTSFSNTRTRRLGDFHHMTFVWGFVQFLLSKIGFCPHTSIFEDDLDFILKSAGCRLLGDMKLIFLILLW